VRLPDGGCTLYNKYKSGGFMYREVSKLLLYSNLGGDSILEKMADIFRDWETGSADKAELTGRIFKEIKKIYRKQSNYF
jgi:hypothetical protein